MLIDAHVHLNNYVENENKPTLERVNALLRNMDANGIDHSVVLTSYKVNVDRPSTEEVVEALSEHKRFTVVEGLRWRARIDLPPEHRKRVNASWFLTRVELNADPSGAMMITNV